LPLKRKYAFIFASYNNPCGAAGNTGSLELTATDPPDFIADLTLERQACRPTGFTFIVDVINREVKR
jgi:hypothetical protein